MRRRLLFTVALLVSGCSAPAPGPFERSPSHSYAAGNTFRDCSECPEMVAVPAGEFVMGSPADEPGRTPDEGPQRQVRIDGFAAGRFPVTRDEWQAFVEATGWTGGHGCAWTGRTGGAIDPNGSWRDLGFPQQGDHPVVCVGWTDVQAYLAWLAARTGRPYRLLSEAEWEYAARGGTRSAFWWGAVASHEYANYGADECCSLVTTGRDQWEYTSPVHAFPANPFGLYDMHGNTLEWVQDCLSASYDGLAAEGSAYLEDRPLGDDAPAPAMKGTRSCDYRVVRGGDYNNPPDFIRSAARNFAPPPDGPRLDEYRSGGLGFRVALSLD